MLDHASIMPCKRSVVAVFTALLCFCCLVGYTQSRLEINEDAVEFWANSIGQQLHDRCQNASGIEVLQKEYEKAAPLFKSTDGSDLVTQTAQRIESFLRIRYDAANLIKTKAETAFEHHTSINYTCSDFTYYNSKDIKIYKDLPDLVYPDSLEENVTYGGPNLTFYLPLYDEWRKYYQVPVSLNSSAIHVPTNIYKCAPPLLDNISWTKELDKTFAQNYDDMPSAWQYFASSAGFMRFYPAANWTYDGMDMYDARLTEWYTGAASTPKSVIILLDNSGSMTGLRMEIAKTTVRKIMESLQENDFFNLITFNNDTSFVDCDCPFSNGTLIQATSKNIRRVSDALKDVDSEEIANFSRAFTVAFEVLMEANESKLTGGESNNAIMLVTDGAPESYEDVFKEYNWDNVTVDEKNYRILKWVRVFSYLIGQEVTPSNKEQVKWMACANKGYFYHIGTMADVHDYVQDYLRVMARPLAVHNLKRFTWSGVHVNMPLTNENNAYNSHARTTDWIRVPSTAAKPTLTISVATPVYDLRDDERKNGNLLGVAGVDINLDEILDLIPRPQLGALGYAFIINNNGFIISHPDLSPWMGPCGRNELCKIVRENYPDLRVNMPKPDYRNVNLLYLEQELDPQEGQLDKLRKEMIDGNTGKISATVKKFYSKKFNRVYIQTQTYYYAPIKGTPYSIAIVRAEPSDSKYMYSDSTLDIQAFDWCRIIVADWNFCEEPMEGSGPYTSRDIIEDALERDSCDKYLAKSVAFDAHITREIHAVWDRNNFDMVIPSTEDESECQVEDEVCVRKKMLAESRKTLKFDMVMLGTRSGVTRFQEMNSTIGMDMKTCNKLHKTSDFVTPSIDADYYKKAAINRKHIWAFSSKVNQGFQETSTTNYISVTASKGIYIEEDPLSKPPNSDNDILTSVFGLSIQYDSIFQLFTTITSFCHEGLNCNATLCSNNDVNCYLLDENGYVVVAEDPDLVGESFGDIDYQILLDMKEKGLFEEVPVTDYQAVCTVCDDSYGSNSASSILNPFKYLFKILVWHITNLALFFTRVSIMDVWHCVYYATAEVLSPELNDTKVDVKEYVSAEKHMVLYMSGTPGVNSASNQLLSDCVSCRVVTNSNSTLDSLGFDVNSTTTETVLFVGDFQNLTEICEIKKVCNRSYVATKVAKTNLYLLVLEGMCTCDGQRLEQCFVKEELTYGCTNQSMIMYRRPPVAHGTAPPVQNNNKEVYKEELLTCGRSSPLSASLIMTIGIQVLLHGIGTTYR